MKIIPALIILLLPCITSAQDVITLKSGKKLDAKISEIRQTKIVYRKPGMDSTLLYLNKTGVSTIKYHNGALEQFGDTANLQRRVFLTVNNKPRPTIDIEKFLAANMVYPEKAVAKRTEGTVMVKFIVNEDGALSDFKITKSLGEGCDEEVIRVLKKMPRWKPGLINGSAVKVYYSQPVNFKLK